MEGYHTFLLTYILYYLPSLCCAVLPSVIQRHLLVEILKTLHLRELFFSIKQNKNPTDFQTHCPHPEITHSILK